MSNFLYPLTEKAPGPQKRLVYLNILTDIARASSDGVEALSLFRDLLYEDSDADSPGFMAFDAHGGDTGCHLRAGMLREFFQYQFEHYRSPRPSSEKPLWLEDEIRQLKSVHERAKTVCYELSFNKVLPEKLGFKTKEESPLNILAALGWKEPPLCSTVPPTGAEAEDSTEETENPSYLDMPAVFRKLENLSLDRIAPSDCCEDNATPHDGLSSRASSRTSESIAVSYETGLTSRDWTSDDEIADDLVTKWDMNDSRTMIRFLIFSYTLSKYKAFVKIKNGSVGARLLPEAAEAAGVAVTLDHINDANPHYRRTKTKTLRIQTEFKLMQPWLTDLSCAWQRSLAEKSLSQLKLTSLIVDSIQVSAARLATVACFPSFLLLRETWTRNDLTLILVDRHFCPHGFHFNVFLATLSGSSINGSATSNWPVHWELRRTTFEALRSFPDQAQPHIITVGNSIEDGVDRYRARLAQGEQETEDPLSQVHTTGHCAENEAHIARFMAADHDRIALAAFADHSAYAFPLVSGVDERTFVESCMDTFDDRVRERSPNGYLKPPGLKQAWARAIMDADEVGAGKQNMSVFAWQHVMLETKGRLAGRLQKWTETNSLMPLAASVGVYAA